MHSKLKSVNTVANLLYSIKCVFSENRWESIYIKKSIGLYKNSHQYHDKDTNKASSFSKLKVSMRIIQLEYCSTQKNSDHYHDKDIKA